MRCGFPCGSRKSRDFGIGVIHSRDHWVPLSHVVSVGHPGVPDGRRRSDGAVRTALCRQAARRRTGQDLGPRGGTRSGAGTPAALGGRRRRRGVGLIRGPQRTSCFSCCAWERRTGGGNAGAASAMAGDGQGRWPVLCLRGQGRVFLRRGEGARPVRVPGRSGCPASALSTMENGEPGEVLTWTCRSPRRRATGRRRPGRARTGRARRARSRRRSPRGSPRGWFRAGRRRPAGRSSG